MIRVQVQGAAELESALKNLSTRVSRRLIREALEFAAEPMRAEAAHRAPRAPGKPDLADHFIISRARTIGKEDAAVAVGPERGVYWGLFQELGTAHHGAQPFMRPAFETQQAKAVQRVAQELWRALAARGVSRSATESTVIESVGSLL